MNEPATRIKELPKCEICDESLLCRWTDTHGIGACLKCGAPYRIYHYENDRRIEKPPKIQFTPKWTLIAKRYWKEVGHNCLPGAYNFLGSSYEVATEEDFNIFNAWMEAHKSELPKEADDDDSNAEG